MPFDPKAFLAEDKGSGGFDPKAFLGEEKPAAAKDPSLAGVRQAQDVVNSGAVGVAKGAAGMAGTVNDAGNLMAAGADAAGFDTKPGQEALDKTFFGKVKKAITPTSEGINAGIQRMFGEYHKPETTAGKYAETIGEMVPMAPLGPVNAARGAIMSRVAGAGLKTAAERAAAKGVTGAVVPGVASEAAGQATEGTSLEPWARAGAAVLAGPRGSRHPTREPAIDADRLFQSGERHYQNARRYDIEYAPQGFARTARNTLNHLENNRGIDADFAPHTFRILEDIASRRTPMSHSEFETYRQKLLNATRSVANPHEVAAGWSAINSLEHYMGNIPTRQVVRGTVADAEAARRAFQAGRADWGAAKRMQMVEGKVMRGELNAETAYSGQNAGNAARQSMKQLIAPNPKGVSLAQKHGFNDAEQEAVRGVTRGNMVTNRLRDAANVLGKGHSQMLNLAGMAAAYHQDDPRYLLATLAGRGLNMAHNASTRSHVNRVMQQIGERSDLARRLGPMNPGQLDRATAAAILRAKQASTPDGYPYYKPEGSQ